MTSSAGDTPVATARCADYRPQDVEAALERLLAPLGGMSAFVSPGQRVLLKVNLLSKAAPDRAVTTHPEVVRAVVRAVRAAGASEVLVGDSPGGRNTAASARGVFEESGLAAVCAEEGAAIALLDDHVTRVRVPEGKLYTAFNLGAQAVEADVLISLPKLKTHGFMMFTGGVKNLFGCIPGLEKAQFHLKVPDRGDFAEMLVDLYLACAPELTIMDGVIGMEGEGPAGGPPRAVGVLLASVSAPALDVVASAIAGFRPADVYTNLAASRRGLTSLDPDEIEVRGEPWRTFLLSDFAHPERDISSRLPGGLARWVRRRIVSRPYLRDRDACTACRTCERDCPVEAIAMADKRPHFDYDRCIRCYCCQELCPQQVIGLRRPWAVRAFFAPDSARKA
jgi:uncharacterized protein (DUF362 family)/Pyruvate/2-oxoacid:ferredoxin oxidoreductase delta subunit